MNIDGDDILALIAAARFPAAAAALPAWAATAAEGDLKRFINAVPSPWKLFLPAAQGGRPELGKEIIAFYDLFADVVEQRLPVGDEFRRLPWEHAAYAHACVQDWKVAAALRSKAYAEAADTLGPDHSTTRLIRSNVAHSLRSGGNVAAARRLLDVPTHICIHLEPAEAYVKQQGGHIASVGTPWSKNCRTWVYFESVIIDAPSIIARLKLPPCVQLAENDDERSGTEYGLYCSEHHDALMGAHPRFATGRVPTIG